MSIEQRDEERAAHRDRQIIRQLLELTSLALATAAHERATARQAIAALEALSDAPPTPGDDGDNLDVRFTYIYAPDGPTPGGLTPDEAVKLALELLALERA